MKEDSTKEELQLLLRVIPPRFTKAVESHGELPRLIEIILDLGKSAEVRYADGKVFYIPGDYVAQTDIDFVTSAIGQFTSDNRAGIERTLHRISAMRNRIGRIVGLTCRVGRAIYGTIDIILDIVESGKNILFVGPPGIGKTTKLRESARILADKLNKRVIVVDTSNEIAGDGDIPHHGIGKARRMQVPSPERQHAVMIEAVENHMPQAIIVDEIGTEAEALACRTIAERGVQLIATAHGRTLDNLVSNPTLSDLVGGVQTVILGDEEAKRRRTQKAVLERKAPPTFDILIEIRERDMFAVYHDVSKAVDTLLRGRAPEAEMRVRTKEGKITVKKAKEEIPLPTAEEAEKIIKEKDKGPLRIFPFGVNRGELDRGLRVLSLPAVSAGNLDEADLILTVKSKTKPGSKIMLLADEHNLPVHIIKKNVSAAIMKFLKFYFKTGREESDEAALNEAEEAIVQVKKTKKSVDLSPQNAYLRRLQHQKVEESNLSSESVGEEPNRRLRIYPAK